MELSEHELRVLTKEVDDQHRDSMQSMASTIAELHSNAARRLRSRRDLLRAGVGAGAITIGRMALPFDGLLSPAWGQALDDGAIAAFAESVELAAAEAYGEAGTGGSVTTPAVAEAAAMFAAHHTEHARAFGGAAGAKATGKANPKLLAAVNDQLKAARAEAGVVQIAYDLENGAAATYMFALGALESKGALELTASILPVESQHAVVLGQVLGKPAADYVPGFESEAAAISPATFPIS